MKRLLEWKQRMLQSPLTRKSSRYRLFLIRMMQNLVNETKNGSRLFGNFREFYMFLIKKTPIAVQFK